jgi:hypothetical protein
MARLIFIFPIILVYFLTIVSKTAFCESNAPPDQLAKLRTFFGKDTSTTLFNDDFESGKLSGWKQTDDWEVSASEKITGNFSLRHLRKSASGSSSIFHSISTDWNSVDLEWSFQLKDGKWDPSSSNRFWFYLSADTIKTELISGYAVGVNISGSNDLLSIWRIKNGKADSLIVQSDLDWNASTLANISVKRTTQGNWTLTYQKSGDPNPKSFSGTDPTIFAFKNIGIYFKYTTTRSGQLWIDDVSVNQSTPELTIKKLLLVNSNLLTITFNSPIDPVSIHSGNFKMADENNQNISIIQVVAGSNSNLSIDISFSKVEGTELTLLVSDLSDLSGKTMKPETRTISYSFPPEAESILINEILFNPFSGGVDFVELINVSENSIPVHRLMLATRNDTLALKQIYPLCTEKRYLKPGQHLCCTKDSAIIMAQYFTNNPEAFCQMKSFPSFSDDAGIVVLLNDSLEVLDEFHYSAKMHSPFLADENGVSLERISIEKPTADRNNWASAASSVGFATPGLPNSQSGSSDEIQDEITPEPQAFSPNDDGYNDELAIRFKLSKPGYIANVRIFDIAGRQVAFLVKNQSLAQEGSWIWKGDNDSGQKQTIGVYIILVELFDQAGHTKAFKKTCMITDRMN